MEDGPWGRGAETTRIEDGSRESGSDHCQGARGPYVVEVGEPRDSVVCRLLHLEGKRHP